MQENKKLYSILIVTVLLPITILILNNCFIADKYFFWGYDCSNKLVYSANIIAILGLMYSLKIKNYRSFWLYVLLGIGILHLLLYYILSNFAF